MKKFYIKQKVFSFTDKYRIFNEYEEEVYFAKKNLMFDELHLIRKSDNKEVFFIRRKIFSFISKYFLHRENLVVASIAKKITFFSNKFDIESKYGNFRIDGDWLAHDFIIYNNSDKMASIHKAYLSFGDCYEITVNSNENEKIEFYLALVIMIDNCIHNNRNNN